MNIHIYKKRLKGASRREREIIKRIETENIRKATKRKLRRQLSNIRRGKVNLRVKISKLREKKRKS